MVAPELALEAAGALFVTGRSMNLARALSLVFGQRNGAVLMVGSGTAKRCRDDARPRGTCLASARHSAGTSRLKPGRGNCSPRRLRTALGPLVAERAEVKDCG